MKSLCPIWRSESSGGVSTPQPRKTGFRFSMTTRKSTWHGDLRVSSLRSPCNAIIGVAVRGVQKSASCNKLVMFRSLLEKATRRSSFRRSLPALVGGSRIYVSGSAGLKYIFRSMDRVDPILCALAKEFVLPGNVIWDVGANVGLFSFAAAHLCGVSGKVVAFEPDVWLVQLLRQSSRIQPRSSGAVQVIPVGVAETCDIRAFNIASRSRSANFLAEYGSTQIGGVAERQTVVCVTLDWLAERLALPDILKIDVEGAELEVLRGAVALLQKKRPIVICEVSSERSPEVTALFQANGYVIFDGERALSERRELDAAPWSTLALPRKGESYISDVP
jgi:FkbM family methyltransferase